MANLLKSNNQKVNPPNNIVAPKFILYQIFLFSKNSFFEIYLCFIDIILKLEKINEFFLAWLLMKFSYQLP